MTFLPIGDEPIMVREEFDQWWESTPPPLRDAAIAEEIMGWHRAACTNWPENKHEQPWLDEDSCFVAAAEWSPTTDITAAWQVVNYIRTKFYWTMKLESMSILPWSWTCQFRLDFLFGSVVGAASAPEAICKAALIAIREIK